MSGVLLLCILCLVKGLRSPFSDRKLIWHQMQEFLPLCSSIIFLPTDE
jgi:hypothetical protein